ncbi:MAG TPA: hypothetical protein VFX38_04055 [Gammaproteobacteria bacterium]|nr:hypothetical protein [Gammaproteobacteria bacterium]
MSITTLRKGLAVSLAMAAFALLGACVVEPTPQPQSQLVLTAAPTTGTCTSCGVITSVQTVEPADYRVTIRMDTGDMRTLDQAQQPAFQVGDRVQIVTRTQYPSG